MRRHRRILLGGLAALLLGLVAVTALTGGQQPSPPAAAQAGAAQVHDELCAAVRSSDVAEAADRFNGRIHAPLHELAAAAQAQDRAVAARLLEAKQRVEAVLDGDRSTLLTQLDALEPAVRNALAVTGTTTSPCQETR